MVREVPSFEFGQYPRLDNAVFEHRLQQPPDLNIVLVRYFQLSLELVHVDHLLKEQLRQLAVMRYASDVLLLLLHVQFDQLVSQPKQLSGDGVPLVIHSLEAAVAELFHGHPNQQQVDVESQRMLRVLSAVE